MADIIQGDEALNRRFEALRNGTADRRLLGQFGLLAVSFAKDLVPRKTGNLGRTIRVGDLDVKGQSISIIAGGDREVGYAAMVEFGTSPHLIVPVSAKALAWGGSRRLSGNLRSGSSPTSFAKRVNHPGTRPKPYLVPGAKKALREVGKADAIVTTWNNAA